MEETNGDQRKERNNKKEILSGISKKQILFIWPKARWLQVKRYSKCETVLEEIVVWNFLPELFSETEVRKFSHQVFVWNQKKGSFQVCVRFENVFEVCVWCVCVCVCVCDSCVCACAACRSILIRATCLVACLEHQVLTSPQLGLFVCTKVPD